MTLEPKTMHRFNFAIVFSMLFCVSQSACTANDWGQYTGRNSQPAQSPLVKWPIAQGNEPVDYTIRVPLHFDGEMKRYYGVGDLGTASQSEEQEPLFKLDHGAVLENVILGDPAADGIHCNGSCTLRNVWWEDVGEDAATFRGNLDTDVMLVEGGGASAADDKIFQNNRRGSMHIRNFYAEWFGKLYRSCGNCSAQTSRRAIIENVTVVTGPESESVVGINENYGDTAEFRGQNHVYDRFDTVLCQRYEGNNISKEPVKLGDGPDGKYCKYDEKNVVVHR